MVLFCFYEFAKIYSQLVYNKNKAGILSKN